MPLSFVRLIGQPASMHENGTAHQYVNRPAVTGKRQQQAMDFPVFAPGNMHLSLAITRTAAPRHLDMMLHRDPNTGPSLNFRYGFAAQRHGEGIFDLTAGQTKMKVFRIAHNVEQKDIGQEVGNLHRIDVLP